MVLSRMDIIKYCKTQALIDHKCFNEKNVQTCSYDLTFSGEYYYHEENHGDHVVITKLQPGEKLRIPADAICYILSAETVAIPDNLTASISLSFGLIKQGVMLAAQPPYDAGYRGKTVALLHNLSTTDVEISIGDHVLNMVFETLSIPVPFDHLYKGKYQELDSLEKYCKVVRKGAVYEIKHELDKQKKHLYNFFPTILTVLSVIIALVTAVISFPTLKDTFSNASNTPTIESRQNFFVSIDGDNNILNIIYEGKHYSIDLEPTQSSK